MLHPLISMIANSIGPIKGPYVGKKKELNAWDGSGLGPLLYWLISLLQVGPTETERCGSTKM